MHMPEPDAAVIAARSELIQALREIVPGEGVIDEERELLAYETDGLTAYRELPMLVVLPETTEQVSAVLKLCHGRGVKIVPRGAGTGLSGGALPLRDGVTLGLGRFNRILEIDYDNLCVVTQPGVTNLAITQAVEGQGFYYAPDPSSQIACSIGGNVAENSGGVHCLKYGVTTNNITGVELVTMAGDVLRIGGRHPDPGGYDLLGVITGSEGLLGVITEVTVKIRPKPEGHTARRPARTPVRPVWATHVRQPGDLQPASSLAGLEMMDGQFAIRGCRGLRTRGLSDSTPKRPSARARLDGTVSEEVADGIAGRIERHVRGNS